MIISQQVKPYKNNKANEHVRSMNIQLNIYGLRMHRYDGLREKNNNWNLPQLYCDVHNAGTIEQLLQ